MPGEAPATNGNNDDKYQEHKIGAMHHPGDQGHIGILRVAITLIEAPEKYIGFLLDVGAEPEGALGRLQGEGIDGADDGGGGDHQGELPEELAGNAGKKGGRQEDRGEDQGDAHDRPGYLLPWP